MGIFHIISAVVLSVTTLFALNRQIHMLQLNSYFLSRYFGWLKKSFSKRTVGSFILTAALALSAFLEDSGILLLIFSLLFALIRIPTALSDYKHSIKKVVFTARVKRMYVTATVILAALCTAFALFGGALQIALLCAILALYFATPALMYLVKWINTPLEKVITNYYINDAEKMLKSHANLKVIGVTGSYGKTGTKHILGRMLSEKYNVLITPGSFNTPLGVVRTVREQLKPTTQVFVVEMGAKNVGDIKEICDIANPTMGVITSVGPQHLDTFGSVENVLKTKFELADCVLKNGGEVFVNIDNEYIREKAKTLSCTTYGSDDSADLHVENISYGRHGSTFDIVGEGRRIAVSTKLLGHHNVINTLSAAAVGMKMGLSDMQIKLACAAAQPVSHRLELKGFIGGSVLIDDAYNANPEGCLEAVRVLGHFDDMIKVIVTPGLVELGEKEYECNYNLGLLAAQICDVIILVGEKRAVPMVDAVNTTDFDKSNLHVVKSFADAMTLMKGFVGKDHAVLFENDLPDNYAG